MSAEAVGWTYRHSPYSGVPLLVHLAIADVANDQNENLFWMSQANLGKKVRAGRQAVNGALAKLLDDGFIELVEDNSKVGKPNCYRFLFPDAEVVYDSRGGVVSGVTPARGGVSSPATGVSSPATGGVVSGDGRVSSEATQNQERTQDGTQVEESSLADPFDEFWKAYPRKAGKPKAAAAYRSAVGKRKADPEVILAGLARWVAYWTAKNEPDYVPHPTTWLNQDRWNDEPPPLPRRSGLSAVADVLEGFDDAGLRPGSTFGPGAASGPRGGGATNPRASRSPAGSEPPGKPWIEGRLVP